MPIRSGNRKRALLTFGGEDQLCLVTPRVRSFMVRLAPGRIMVITENVSVGHTDVNDVPVTPP